MVDHGAHAAAVPGREEERHHPVRERRDAGRDVGEGGVDVAPESAGTLQPRDAARGAGREHRATDVERQVQLRVGAHRRRIGGPGRRLGCRCRDQHPQHHEREGPHEHPSRPWPPQLERRADPRLRPLAQGERGERGDESEPDERGSRGQEHELREHRTGSEPLSLRTRGRGRVAGVLVALTSPAGRAGGTGLALRSRRRGRSSTSRSSFAVAFAGSSRTARANTASALRN